MNGPTYQEIPQCSPQAILMGQKAEAPRLGKMSGTKQFAPVCLFLEN